MLSIDNIETLFRLTCWFFIYHDQLQAFMHASVQTLHPGGDMDRKRAGTHASARERERAHTHTHTHTHTHLTRAGPTPTNISWKSDPEMDRKGTPASPAVALASRVLPEPGGPTSSAPAFKFEYLV